MSKLRLTLACWNYDRTRALADGTVRPDGIELTYLNLPVEETFFRMLRYREFEVAEMSLSSYTVSLFRDDPPFIAIPIFPSRSFRHGSIFVSAKSGIREPKELIGKRVGNPEYQLTAQVWIRGILSDEYGVAPTSVEYWIGGEEEPGREEKIALDLPSQIKIRRIGANQTLSQMLADGELDALYAPGFRQHSCQDRRTYTDSSRITTKLNGLITRRRRSFPSCIRSWSAATSTKRILGSRGHSTKHLSSHSVSSTKTSKRPRRSRPCCRGSPRTSRNWDEIWGLTGGLTASSPIGM